MTTDQLTDEQKAASGLVGGYFDSHGWGFGLSVVTRRDDLAAVPGRFGWDGGLGTSWYSDPREEIVGILLTQRAWTSPNPPQFAWISGLAPTRHSTTRPGLTSHDPTRDAGQMYKCKTCPDVENGLARSTKR